MDPVPQNDPAVAEVQGLYGPFSFPERLLQKIWLRGDFDRLAARTIDGRRIMIRHSGRWNLLGGPDFRDARISFDNGVDVECDVELHLHASDWEAHGHARDPAYARVGLHVVLFPPPAGHVTRGGDGRTIPVLALLPLLHHDLEEFAADDAVEAMTGRASARIPDELARLTRDELADLLSKHASARWDQKVHFARLRLQRLGWDSACHHVALEVLGYRFNRAPMLRVAARWPLADWERQNVDAESSFAAEQGAWSLQGVRPANHPNLRLRQYARWATSGTNWPEKLKRVVGNWPELATGSATREVRRRLRFSRARDAIISEVCAGVLGGTRIDNLICDGFLPLIAASERRDLSGWWFHWFVADLPPYVARCLRELAVFDGKSRPACQGAAQGFLGWWIEHEGPAASR